MPNLTCTWNTKVTNVWFYDIDNRKFSILFFSLYCIVYSSIIKCIMTTVNRSKTYLYFDWPKCALLISVHANCNLKCLFGDWITSVKNWLLESFVIFWLYLFYLWFIQWTLSIFFLQYNFFSTVYYDHFSHHLSNLHMYPIRSVV